MPPGRLPRGLQRTAKGWRVTIKRTGQRTFTKRFPFTVDQEKVEAYLEKMRNRLGAGLRGPDDGTLGADVTRYLRDYFSGRPAAAYEERERQLQLWVDAFGPDTYRDDITRDDISRVLHQWRASGLAADTCNKRRTALLALYHALDGRGGRNPVREVPKFRPPDALPRGLDYTKIRRALQKLPRCATRARLALMAYTGLRQGQLMKLSPDDWDTRRHVLMAPGTEKGRGTKPYVIPLSGPAEDALREIDALDAWGAFTWAPMARLWRQAWYAMMTGQKRTPRLMVPAEFVAPVPYDLRHSFGTLVFRATGDLKSTKELLGHSSLRMTERYMLAAVPERQRSAMKAFEKALRGRPKLRAAR
jgi:integrase